MNLSKQLKAVNQEYQKKIDNLTEALKLTINSFPDNPRITRINKNCFILNSKDLLNNWTPEFHDFKKQYSLVADIVSRAMPENKIKVIEEAIQKKSIVVKNSGASPYTVHLHDDVVAHLSKLVET